MRVGVGQQHLIYVAVSYLSSSISSGVATDTDTPDRQKDSANPEPRARDIQHDIQSFAVCRHAAQYL